MLDFLQNRLRKAAWSPYLVGAGIGVLSWFTFLLVMKMLNISKAFIRIVGFLIGFVSLDYVSKTNYMAKYVEFKPVFEWQTAIFVGVFLGALVSAKLSGVTFTQIPYIWGQNFGFSKRNRAIGAAIGGFLIIFGAYLAGGCTLGHAISGGMQLATDSWVFIPVLFSAGIISSFILYRKR